MGYAQNYAARFLRTDEAGRRYRAYQGIDRIADDQERKQIVALYQVFTHIENLKENALMMGLCFGALFGLYSVVIIMAAILPESYWHEPAPANQPGVAALLMLALGIGGVVGWGLMRWCYSIRHFRTIRKQLQTTFQDSATRQRLETIRQLDPNAVTAARRFLPAS